VQTRQQKEAWVWRFFYFESLWNATAEAEICAAQASFSLFPSPAPRAPL